MVFQGGAYIVHLFDNYAVAPSILIVVFLEVMGVMYGYGKILKSNIHREINRIKKCKRKKDAIDSVTIYIRCFTTSRASFGLFAGSL